MIFLKKHWIIRVLSNPFLSLLFKFFSSPSSEKGSILPKEVFGLSQYKKKKKKMKKGKSIRNNLTQAGENILEKKSV